jgi:hypothetical protein
VQTRERGPPSALAEIWIVFNHVEVVLAMLWQLCTGVEMVMSNGVLGRL